MEPRPFRRGNQPANTVVSVTAFPLQWSHALSGVAIDQDPACVGLGIRLASMEPYPCEHGCCRTFLRKEKNEELQWSRTDDGAEIGGLPMARSRFRRPLPAAQRIESRGFCMRPFREPALTVWGMRQCIRTASGPIVAALSFRWVSYLIILATGRKFRRIGPRRFQIHRV